MNLSFLRKVCQAGAIAIIAFFQLAGSESCTVLQDDAEEDDTQPPGTSALFTDPFSGTLAFWLLSIPVAPGLDPASGNGLPSMVVGSAALLPTGALTIPVFTYEPGLVIEADVHLLPPSPPPAVPPQVWVGLSSELVLTTPVTSALAAGQFVDAAGGRHFIVNGAIVFSTGAPATGSWHRLFTTIRTDGKVDFGMDGVLEHTSSATISAAYANYPVKVGGDGFPERPHIDNVSVRRP